MAIQRGPLRYDTLKVQLRGKKRAVVRGLVPPLHMVPYFSVDGGGPRPGVS